MKYINKKFFSFLLVFLIVFTSGTVFAYANGTKNIKTLDFVYVTNNKEEKYTGFEESLEVDDNIFVLEDITYEILESTPIKEEIVVNKVIESGFINLEDKFEAEKSFDENGITYNLTDLSIVENSKYSELYSEVDTYLSIQDIPQNKEVVIELDKGRESIVNLNLVGLNELNEGQWIDNKIKITFENYDSNVFQWQGLTIAASDEPLKGYEVELLESVNADLDLNTVVSTYWDGEPYIVDGITYRDATAEIKSFYNFVEATYSKSVDFVKYECNYEGIKIQDSNESNYKIKAVASYVEEASLTPTQLVLACVGVAIIAVGIVLTMLVLSKKKNHEERSS